MGKKRERISSISAVLMPIFAVFFTTANAIPFIGTITALIWSFVLFWWLFTIPGSKLGWVAAVATFQTCCSALTVVPVIGNFFAFLLSWGTVATLILFIRSVRAEDTEYNKKHGLA